VIRKAKREDLDAIVEIAVESVGINPLPVKNNTAEMKITAEQCLQPAHFMWVAEVCGVVVGAVAAQVAPSFWFDKLNCSVLLYYTRKPHGLEGLKLLREFSKWVKSRSGIKVAVFELEPDVDPRLVRYLRRLGFVRESLNLAYVRGGNNE
jgi:hypothetical protein